MFLGPRWLRSLTPVVMALSLSAQDVDLPERLFRSGERAYSSRSVDEAFETWNQLLKQAPASPQAAQALLLMARHLAEVAREPDKALGYLDLIRDSHMNTPSAPEALFLRGQILSSRARQASEQREAMSELHRVVDLWPKHAVVPHTHLVLGKGYRRQGSLGNALDHFAEVLRWDPQGPEAAEAMFLMGETLDMAGDLNGCLRTLQSLKDRFPDHPLAKEAAWRLGVRARHRLQKPPLRSMGPWPSGKEKKWLKTPTLLAMDSSGRLCIYQSDLDQAFLLTEGALQAAGPSWKDAKALFIGPGDQVGLVAPKTGITMTGQSSPIPLGSLSHPTGACFDCWGNLWISDAKAGALGIFFPDGTSRTIPSPGLIGLASLPGGLMVGASDANRTFQVLDGTGQPRTTWSYGQGLPSGFKYVLSLTTDPTGHIAAIVDGDFEGVVIWGPKGDLLRWASFKELGISGRFRAIALDHQGGVILADRTNDVLIRLH